MCLNPLPPGAWQYASHCSLSPHIGRPRWHSQKVVTVTLSIAEAQAGLASQEERTHGALNQEITCLPE
jgi:hypothetical protein